MYEIEERNKLKEMNTESRGETGNEKGNLVNARKMIKERITGRKVYK
jgi:hypothetical protein